MKGKYRLLFAILGVSVLIFVISSPAWAAEPRGELRVAVPGWVREALDPNIATNGVQAYNGYMYDWLVGLNEDGEFSRNNGLARDWKLSPNGKVWTFFLHQGVRFHNGDEVTAEDVKFTIERNISPNSRTAAINACGVPACSSVTS